MWTGGANYVEDCRRPPLSIYRQLSCQLIVSRSNTRNPQTFYPSIYLSLLSLGVLLERGSISPHSRFCPSLTIEYIVIHSFPFNLASPYILHFFFLYCCDLSELRCLFFRLPEISLVSIYFRMYTNECVYRTIYPSACVDWEKPRREPRNAKAIVQHLVSLQQLSMNNNGVKWDWT